MFFLWSVNSFLYGQYFLDFDKLSLEEGLTSSKANGIIQDKKGFIWIGTWNGLSKFDGYNCEVFQPRYHDSTTISNREVSSILEDHNGYIWIGTSFGLNRLDPVTNRIKKYEFQNRIISLCEDKEHKLWIGTWNGGLYKLNPENGSTEHYFAGDIISDIHEDSHGGFWVSTYTGLVNFDRNTGGYVRYMPNPESNNAISHKKVTQIVESRDGNLWVSTWGGGINKIILNSGQENIKFVHYKIRKGDGSITSNVVYKLYYDQYDNLWVGTWDAGLNLLIKSQQEQPPTKAHFYSYQRDLSNPYSLSGNNISAICVDRTGVLWVSSDRIERTSITNNGIFRYKTTLIENGVLKPSVVRSFVRSKDTYFVGTSDEIKMFGFSDGKLELEKTIPQIKYSSDSVDYISSAALSLLKTDKGLWVGTEDAGLVLYPNSFFNRGQSEFVSFNTKTSPSLPGDKVNNLIASKKYEETIWVGTMQSGFCKLFYEQGKPKIENFYSIGRDKMLSDNNVRAMLEDKDGKVWIGTQNGLNCYDPQDRSFKYYFYSQTDTTTINDNVVNALFEDSKGTLWVGTNQGLNKKQIQVTPDGEKTISFKSYPSQNGIDIEIVSNILEDDKGNLWLGLYKGLVKFNIESESVIDEYYSCDYQHVVIERNSSLKDEDGKIFFGGGNGIMYFHPDSLMINSTPPTICMTGLTINNEKITQNSIYSNGLAVPYLSSLKLTYNDKVVTFGFSAMNFKDPDKNKYTYILEGFDEGWNDVGNQHTATYTNINPGEYTFKVKAANSDGIWSKDYLLLKVKVLPPWWKTTLAYVTYAILIFGLLYFFNRYSIIEIREKGRLKIESVKNEKENELNELKYLFFTNITHEFRTPLTLIVGPVGELLKTKGLPAGAYKHVELIQRNAQRLLRLVNQLMEFRKVEKGKMDIHPQHFDVAQILTDTYDVFKAMANSKEIYFDLTLKSKSLIAMVDAEKFEKAFFNIVSNAFKYTENGGKIRIWAGFEQKNGGDKQLIIEVEDTGIGIDEEHKDKVFERFFQVNQRKTQSTGGIGLYLSKTFIELHGGFIELNSELGKGSCFRIAIPVPSSVELMVDENKAGYDGVSGDKENYEFTKLDRKSVKVTNGSRDKLQAKVLVVEDDIELNEFLISGLSAEFKTIGCLNGKEGLEIAKKQDPDIIITDIMMPKMDGIELCKRLRKDLSTSHIPVIFLTAKTMYEDEVKGLKMGAVDYIYKPFNLISLRLKIRNQLDNRKSIHHRMKAVEIMEPENVELSDLDEDFLKNAVNAVNNNLDDPSFDVEKFSAVIGVGPNQVYRKIKALTGQTAKEFIRNQRLKTAAQLLMQKKRSITDVIYMVGFSSPSYFTRCFREYYGCAPSEYIDKKGKVNLK